MGLARRQSNGLVEIPDRGIDRAKLMVQLTPVLQRLPQARVQADGFRQKGNRPLRLPGRGELYSPVQLGSGVRGCAVTPAAADIKVRREQEAEAR